MTQIYFLLGRGQFSRLHRIASDELWHFYQGSPLLVIEADPETGAVKETTLGGEDGVPFHVVPGGTWFGSRSLGEWSFVVAVAGEPCGAPLCAGHLATFLEQRALID
jgi:uncharacterized protein